jgi:hypothetical protein
MELPGSGYLYTIAALAMTFVGFTSIVLVFRQNVRASPITALHSHGYLEFGFSAAAFAMLPPLLATFDLSAPVIWRSTSLVMAIVMIGHHWFTMHRFLRTSGRLPLRYLINSGITLIVAFVLLANAVGWPFDPQLGPVAAGVTLRLFIGAEIFMLTFEDFLMIQNRPSENEWITY